VAQLEARLRNRPDDNGAARQLLRILDYHLPSEPGLGSYSDCQHVLAAQYGDGAPTDDLLDAAKAAGHYREWSSILASMAVDPKIAVTQLFAGQFHSILGKPAHCSLHKTLFQTEGVISRFCLDCYKVQILPLDLKALVQTYVVLRGLELPRDNSRKCMIELRENVPYPYKAYIYCESEQEAELCRKILRQALESSQVENVYCGISHGCSEFGIRYPEYKYSEDGSHRNFQRPMSWNRTEAEFFSRHLPAQRPRKDYNHRNVTLSDVIALRTWIDYAELIGDETWKQFGDHSRPDKPEPFATRAARQSELRQGKRQELAEKIASAA